MQIICIQVFSSPELSGLYVVDQEENHFLKGRGYEPYRVFPHLSSPSYTPERGQEKFKIHTWSCLSIRHECSIESIQSSIHQRSAYGTAHLGNKFLKIVFNKF